MRNIAKQRCQRERERERDSDAEGRFNRPTAMLISRVSFNLLPTSSTLRSFSISFSKRWNRTLLSVSFLSFPFSVLFSLYLLTKEDKQQLFGPPPSPKKKTKKKRRNTKRERERESAPRILLLANRRSSLESLATSLILSIHSPPYRNIHSHRSHCRYPIFDRL